jgi:ATP-dependent helicase/nuclease subunit A
VIAEKRQAVALAEEMRVLYVALTRAKDRLILTASQKRTDCGTVLRRGVLLSDETVPDWLLKECKSPLEWLLYGLADQRPLHEAFETDLADKARDDTLLALTVYGVDEVRALSQEVQRLRDRGRRRPSASKSGMPSSTRGRRLLADLGERLDWRYPFDRAVREPAKQSVTALTHRDDEFTRLDYSRALERRPLALTAPVSKPVSPLPARAVGTAVHLVIASLDLTRPVTRAAIEQTASDLVGRGAMSPGVAQMIDADGVLSFFESELGSAVLKRDNVVWREWAFTLGVPVAEIHDAPELPGDGSDEIVVVQGIIDVLVRTSEGLLVIDFKSDRVSGEAVDERAEAYRQQLETYARAAECILASPVREKWLYFLTPQHAVRL